MKAISLSTLAIAALVTVQARAAPNPISILFNPHGWPCPPGYYAAEKEKLCRLIRTPRPGPERDRIKAQALKSVAKWDAEMAKEKERAEELKQEAHRKAQEAERERSAAREADEKRDAAERKRITAEADRRNAETRKRLAEAAAVETRRRGEERRRAEAAAAEQNRRAAKEAQLAEEEERKALAAENEARAAAAEEDRRTEAAARQLALQRQAKLEAEISEKHRHGIFGEESLRQIVDAADNNTVRFERYYKGKQFSGTGAFKTANKAILGKDLAVTIALRHGNVVCFIDRDKAEAAADLGDGSRVAFSGTISGTAPLIGQTLQLKHCAITT